MEERKEALGPAGQRADRDFRKQKIMTCRTLLLENWLVLFIMLNEKKPPKDMGEREIESFLSCLTGLSVSAP